MDHVHGNDHVDGDAEGGNPGQEAGEQAKRTQAFSHDGEKREDRGDAHLAGKESHGAPETVAPEPAKQLLHPVREEHDPEQDPEDHCCGVILCLE